MTTLKKYQEVDTYQYVGYRFICPDLDFFGSGCSLCNSEVRKRVHESYKIHALTTLNTVSHSLSVANTSASYTKVECRVA